MSLTYVLSSCSFSSPRNSHVNSFEINWVKKKVSYTLLLRSLKGYYQIRTKCQTIGIGPAASTLIYSDISNNEIIGKLTDEILRMLEKVKAKSEDPSSVHI